MQEEVKVAPWHFVNLYAPTHKRDHTVTAVQFYQNVNLEPPSQDVDAPR